MRLKLLGICGRGFFMQQFIRISQLKCLWMADNFQCLLITFTEVINQAKHKSQGTNKK